MCSAVAVYHASGSREIHSSAGFSVCPKKNQCHQLEANRASHRARCSAIGTQSMTTSCNTERGWSRATRYATAAPRS